MRQELLERSEAYLEGRLDAEETARFEQELVRPDNAAAFREALLMRELLRDLPPEGIPEGLLEQIDGALAREGVFDGVSGEAREATSRLGALIGGTAWLLRGPAIALGGAGVATGARGMTTGLSTMRYALGPLAVGGAQKAPPPTKAPLWRRILRYRKGR